MTTATKNRPATIALGVGVLVAIVWLVFLTSLSLGPRAFLAVLAGALMAFVTYAKQRGPGQDAVRRAALATAAIGLLCFVGLVLVALG